MKAFLVRGDVAFEFSSKEALRRYLNPWPSEADRKWQDRVRKRMGILHVSETPEDTEALDTLAWWARIKAAREARRKGFDIKHLEAS